MCFEDYLPSYLLILNPNYFIFEMTRLLINGIFINSTNICN